MLLLVCLLIISSYSSSASVFFFLHTFSSQICLPAFSHCKKSVSLWRCHVTMSSKKRKKEETVMISLSWSQWGFYTTTNRTWICDTEPCGSRFLPYLIWLESSVCLGHCLISPFSLRVKRWSVSSILMMQHTQKIASTSRPHGNKIGITASLWSHSLTSLFHLVLSLLPLSPLFLFKRSLWPLPFPSCPSASRTFVLAMREYSCYGDNDSATSINEL